MNFLPEGLPGSSPVIALPGQNTSRITQNPELMENPIRMAELTLRVGGGQRYSSGASGGTRDFTEEEKTKISKEHIEKIQQERVLAYEFERGIEESDIQDLVMNLYTTEEIDNIAVINVSSEEDNGPLSLRDPRMGPHSENQPCQTCFKTHVNCIGHFGKLVVPTIPHPQCLPIIVDILKVVCNSCGGLLFNRQELEFNGVLKYSGLNRLREMKNLIKSTHQCTRSSASGSKDDSKSGEKRCAPNPTFKSAKNSKDKAKIFYTYGDSDQVFWYSPDKVANIFSSISEEDAKLMGFVQGAHPRNMIIDRILVLPLSTRPDVYQGGRMMPDDFTVGYKDLIRFINEYKREETSARRKEDLLDSICYTYGHILNNSDQRYKQGNVKIFKSLKQRVQGKTGLVAESLMGKRVNFAARTVGDSGPDLRVDEVGIPRIMAKELTVPVVVTTYNREELQTCYDENRVNSITRKKGAHSGQRVLVSASFKKKFPNYRLQNGDMIERHLQDGDVVIIGRQPTLHKQNMIAVKVRLIDDLVFRINLSLTTPLNADFDGDELNVHVPQTIEAYIEAMQLLSVGHNLMSSQVNAPMMAITYDTLLGSYLLTEPDYYLEVERPAKISELEKNSLELEKQKQKLVSEKQKSLSDPKVSDKMNKDIEKLEQRITKTQKELAILKDEAELEFHRERAKIDPDIFSDLIMLMYEQPDFLTLRQRVEKYGIPFESRKTLFSSVLPIDFYYNKNNIVIKEGVLIQGLINKKAIGAADGGIISEMYKQLGAQKTIDFMSNVQFLIKEYNMHHGFSVGLADCISDNPKFYEELRIHLEDAKLQVEAISIKPGQNVNPIIAEQIEKKSMEILDNAKTKSDNIAMKYISQLNNLQIMSASRSGAKGEATNSIQIMSTMGQQKESGKRIPASLPGGRSLPVYKPGDTDPTSRGFCMESFASQLTPEGFYHHNYASREQLINTSNNTAVTGHLYNKLAKAGEDVHISGDGAVCSASGSIIQFSYSDSFDASHLTSTKINKDSIPFFRNIDTLAFAINSKYQ